VDDRTIDTGLIHQDNGLPWRERGDLPVGCVARQAGAPSVDLSVNDAHEFSSEMLAPSLRNRSAVRSLLLMASHAARDRHELAIALMPIEPT
jgi:hypothetical protein